MRRQQKVGLAFDGDDHRPLAELERRLDGFRNSRADVGGTGLQAVDHDLDVVLDLAVEFEPLAEREDLAVDPGPDVAGLGEILEQILVFPFLTANDRGENRVRGAVGELKNSPGDLLASLGGDGPVAVGTVPLADPGEQDAEVVVDLGDRADGAPGVPPAGLLLDRDRRAEAIDPVDLGLGHLAQELASVARQALDVTPLPLGIKRVEREARLARAADAREADQGPSRQVERDVA